MEYTELARDPAVADALALLSYYRFEFGECPPDRSISEWLETYPASWVRLAIVEALYQGRYKAVSVTQILAAWQRRDQPYPHFNYEFESLVCRHVQMPAKTAAIMASSNPDDPSPTRETIEARAVELVSEVETDERASDREFDEEIVLDEDPDIASVRSNGQSEGVKPGKVPTSIVEFSPIVDRSDFYTRLKTIAEKSQPEGDRPEGEG